MDLSKILNADTLAWEPIANVYVLGDGEVVVRFVGLEERVLAIHSTPPTPTTPAEEWQEAPPADPFAGESMEAMIASVLRSVHCTTAEAAGAAIWEAVSGYLEAQRVGGGGIRSILGPKKLLRPDAPPEGA